jgi:hypothetical protein
MTSLQKVFTVAAAFALVLLLFVSTPQTAAQDGKRLSKSIYIQAQAMGQSTQLGRSFSINVIINELSTPEDQRALLEAFAAKKNEGLVNALSKMNSKGRMSITGTLGYDINYIRKFDLPDGGMKFRLVTDRPIRFGEVWADTRSMDYSLSAAEIVFSKDKKKNSGVLLPACQFKIDDDKQLEIELLQNEWKLVNVRQR